MRAGRPRALAVLLEHSSSSQRRAARRRWYRPALAPLPAEPGRLVVCALLARARRARGCSTPGDDRIETRAYAVKRYLFRLGHAARSGRYACSIEQLVVGLAPVMGWGTVPRGRAQRARFVSAHRKSVQRWLDDLQAAGVVAHEPERDELGRWWRTQIVLDAAPQPSDVELRLAERRARGWRARERARLRRLRRAPALGAIRQRAREPRRATQARLARARAHAVHEARRRAHVEATIRHGAQDRALCGLLTHPFGAPPTSAQSLGASKRSRRTPTLQGSAQAAHRSAPTLEKPRALVVETGARTRTATSRTPAAAPPPREQRSEEIGSLPLAEFDALVERRVAAREIETACRVAARRDHAARRVALVLAWPERRCCPFGRLREAWVAHRYGLDVVAEGGAAAVGPRSLALARRAGQAIALYEAFAAERPAGWPATGPAALCALASLRRAAVLAGDVGRLLGLARAMRAAALEHDAQRVTRAADRASRRRDVASGPLEFRGATRRWETAEQRRQRVRDAVLLAGGDPAAWPNAEFARCSLRDDAPVLIGPDTGAELDGVGARAQRYRTEQANGRWLLPHDWSLAHPIPHAREVSPA